MKKKKWLPIVLVGVVILLGIALMGGDDTTDTNSSDVVATANDQTEDSTAPTEQDVPEESNSITNAVDNQNDAEPVNSNETTSQKNAVRSAKSYLDFSAFSYEGLITQLEFEDYPHEDAVYAADNCGADWNEQAVKSAKAYLDFSAFSYEGLITQLEFDKYTTEQATYAADNCNADWNEQAVKSAKAYLDFSAFSRDSLITQLEFDGFTNEQAVHGANENGY